MPNKIIKKSQNPSRPSAESPLDRGDTNELSYDTKTLITILMLVAVYPVGLVLMLVWMKWNKWVKVLVALPLLFVLLVSIFMFWMLMLVTVKVVFQPNGRIRIIEETMRRGTREEIIVGPTQMMISPTVRVIKK